MILVRPNDLQEHFPGWTSFKQHKPNATNQATKTNCVSLAICWEKAWMHCLNCVQAQASLSNALCPITVNTFFSWKADHKWEITFESFCLRDRNEGRPILLKIASQKRHVDLRNMPKFQVQQAFFSRVLDTSPSGVPRDWFSVQFWPLFNLSFSKAQLIGDTVDPSNFRPISTLNSFAQIFEKLVYSQVLSYLEKHNILNKFQFGFRKGRSTEQAIVEIRPLIRLTTKFYLKNWRHMA